MARIDGNIWNNFITAADLPPGDWAEFHGGWGDDTLWGTENGDRLYGDEGNDELRGYDGNDLLRGGAGNDALYGGDGSDDIQGGDGDDYMSGGSGDDTIVATLGVDVIHGDGGNDDITVEGGDWFRFDRVDGGSGNDTIHVRLSKVLAFGGSGNDTFYTDLSEDTVLVGGTGSDRFVLTADAFGSGRVTELHGGDAVVVTSGIGMESISSVTLLGDSSTDILDLSELEGVGTLSINLSTGTIVGRQDVLFANFDGIENVIGSSDTDLVVGNDADNGIDGRAGDDLLYGLGGDDEIYGAAGDDSILGGAGQDFLYGEAGNDTIYGDSNADHIYGGAGKDKLFGGSGADTLYGDSAGDAVAADTLTGGSGADRFVFTDVANQFKLVETTTSRGTLYGFNVTPIFDTITDFDTSGADHDTIDISYIMRTKAGFGGTYQQAVDQGYLYFVQHGTPGTADFGTQVMIDVNGGTHNDVLNNYVVADLKGILQAEVANRPDLFLV